MRPVSETDGLPPPFFIVGSPRSGTTLLGRILDGHPRIAVYHETHYYPLFRPDLGRYGELRRPANLMRLVEDVREVARVQGFMAPPTARELIAALPEPTFEGVLTALLQLHARQQGKIRAGDKTPDHHAYLAEILEAFPQSPVIFVLRDPRDAVLSIRRALGAGLTGAAWTWNRAFRSYRKFAGRVHLVRYEELVAEPQKTAENICAFLGETFAGEMLRFSERVPESLAARPNFQKLLKEVDADSVGGFRRLTAREIGRIEALCAEGMEALGYPFTAGKPAPVVMPRP
ncbi:MAG TPA: sulfotransferase, partial [Candidatus Binatia bacterium]